MPPKRDGPIWEAMQAAADVLDLNREGQSSTNAYNADVSPIVRLAESILDQCATVADEHAAHEHATSADFTAGWRQAAESIAATIQARKG